MSGILQIVGQASGVSSLLSVDSSGRAVVRDADSIAQTTAVNTALATIDGVLDNSLIQQTAVNTALTTIDVVLDNSLVQQTAVNTALATLETSNQAIKTAVEGTLAVSAPTIATFNTLLRDAVSVADSAVSTTSSVDLGGVRLCGVFGSLSDETANVKVQVSADDSTYFDNSEQTIYIQSGGAYYKTMAVDARYVRLSYTNGSGVAATWTANLSRKL
tara:strand:+ start:1027 stop:1677 length:651 start_codon:yes stop_codon:yes gene_type:complete